MKDYEVRNFDIDEKFLNLFDGEWITKKPIKGCYYSVGIYTPYRILRSTDVSDLVPMNNSTYFNFDCIDGHYCSFDINNYGHSYNFELFYDVVHYKK